MRFYFHITHDTPRVNDTVGVDLPNLKAAWDEATKACGEIIRDVDGDLVNGEDWIMDVHDEAGPVFTIRFAAIDHTLSREERG
jgi:hypothetical protein